MTEVRNTSDVFLWDLQRQAGDYNKAVLYKHLQKGSASPDQLKDIIKEACRLLLLEKQDLIKRAIAIIDSLIKACKPGDADIFVGNLPEFPGKKELQKGIHDARLWEDVAEVNYEEGRSLYRKGRIEEMKGNVAQARDLYGKAIAKVQDGRKLTNCDSRVKQFDKAIGQINSRHEESAGTLQVIHLEGKSRNISCHNSGKTEYIGLFLFTLLTR